MNYEIKKQILDKMQEYDRIILFRHVRNDGDCVGATKGPGSVRARIKWLQSLNEIIIDPRRCPETAKEFAMYEYEQNRDGEFVDAYPDKNNHAIDSVCYATNRIWLRAGA